MTNQPGNEQKAPLDYWARLIESAIVELNDYGQLVHRHVLPLTMSLTVIADAMRRGLVAPTPAPPPEEHVERGVKATPHGPSGPHPFGRCCNILPMAPTCTCPCHYDQTTEPVTNVFLEELRKPLTKPDAQPLAPETATQEGGEEQCLCDCKLCGGTSNTPRHTLPHVCSQPTPPQSSPARRAAERIARRYVDLVSESMSGQGWRVVERPEELEQLTEAFEPIITESYAPLESELRNLIEAFTATSAKLRASETERERLLKELRQREAESVEDAAEVAAMREQIRTLEQALELADAAKEQAGQSDPLAAVLDAAADLDEESLDALEADLESLQKEQAAQAGEADCIVPPAEYFTKPSTPAAEPVREECASGCGCRPGYTFHEGPCVPSAPEPVREGECPACGCPTPHTLTGMCETDGCPCGWKFRDRALAAIAEAKAEGLAEGRMVTQETFEKLANMLEGRQLPSNDFWREGWRRHASEIVALLNLSVVRPDAGQERQ